MDLSGLIYVLNKNFGSLSTGICVDLDHVFHFFCSLSILLSFLLSSSSALCPHLSVMKQCACLCGVILSHHGVDVTVVHSQRPPHLCCVLGWLFSSFDFFSFAVSLTGTLKCGCLVLFTRVRLLICFLNRQLLHNSNLSSSNGSTEDLFRDSIDSCDVDINEKVEKHSHFLHLHIPICLFFILFKRTLI